MSDAFEPAAAVPPLRTGDATSPDPAPAAEPLLPPLVDDLLPGVEAGPAAPDPVAIADTVDLDAIEVELNGVEAAMGRLDAGTYGQCVVCDAPVSDDVLAAAPLATACADHLPAIV